MLEHDVVTVTDLTETIVRLRAAGCVFAEDEAAVLGEAATDPEHLHDLVDRRALGEPLEQVVGYADFCGVRVRLRPGVFVPRIRSELLVHTALAELTTPGRTVVDLCCGSGALALAVREAAAARETATARETANKATSRTQREATSRTPGEATSSTQREATSETRPEAASKTAGNVSKPQPESFIHLHAADNDPTAVACARDNLGKNVHQGDLFTALPPSLRGTINVLLANVPYVATQHIPLLPAEARLHEPHTALDGGTDGLDVFRAVVAEAGDWLAPGGLLLSEITEAQTAAAVDAVTTAGLHASVVEDDDLQARVVTARRTQLPGATGLR